MLIFTESTINAKGERTESNKYYDGRIIQKGSTYVAECRWGRIGAAKGQSLQKEFGYESGAKYFLEDKLREKRCKGYREIDDNEYKVMVAKAQLVGLNNKIISNRWLERTKTGQWIDVDELRLQEPSCFPGLEVVFNDRKTDKTYKFMFTSEGTYVENSDSWFRIPDNHPLAAVSNAVHTAIFSI